MFYSLELFSCSSDASFIIGSASELPIDIKVTNYAETAISPVVIVSWKSKAHKYSKL
jgi:hypothetical protein